ncbi:MAG: hypothetical protein NC416_01255 [Eubacterium sp.]|nr:hypothetical protein [Eubacterium sp.]
MDKKEIDILNHYKNIIEQKEFDEYDILGFLIFIRRHIEKEYTYISEFANLIAHRERDKAIVMRCISSAIDNQYQTKKDGKTVIGYFGMRYETWVNEWKNLARQYNFSLDKNIIKEITICVFSLAQYTNYDDNHGHTGHIELFMGKDNSLGLITVGNKPESLYICFAKCDNLMFKKELSAGHFKEPIKTERMNGDLKIKYMNEYIL